MFNSIKLAAYALWDNLKSWFKYSKTIFIARMEALSGILLGAFTSIDWSALLSLDLSHLVTDTKTLVMAGALFVHGLVIELARRVNPGNLGA